MQPGDQLLSPERKADTPKAAGEDEVDSNTQSKSPGCFFLPGVFGDLKSIHQRGLGRGWRGRGTAAWTRLRPGAGP